MRVTVVCDVLGEANNGTTIAALNLINSLKSKGHDVRVLCPDEDKRDIDGYYIVPTFNFGPFLNDYIAKNGVALAKPDMDVVCDAIDGADIIHVMVPFFLGRAAMKFAREKNIPISAGFHCQAENLTNHLFMMNVSFANAAVYREFYNDFYKYCDCIHFPTQFICDVFEEQVGKTNHYVISNGVNKIFKPQSTEKPDDMKDKFVILFTGRYSKEKSHTVLVDGVAASKYKDKIKLIFAGAGPQQSNIEKYAESLSVKPEFGFYSRSELVDVINYSDLYVHPAEIEIEAISCLEAISCGKVPVISNSPRSATRYFALTDDNLFECNNPIDLAHKIDYWIENPEKRAECSKLYEGYAKQFDFDNCMDKMEAMLLENAKKATDCV